MVALHKVPEMVRNTWRDLRWESEEIPPQGMDHAVVILRGISTSEGELQGMVPEAMVVRVPHEAEYRAQVALESSIISQLFRGSEVRVPETVRLAYARGTFGTPNPVLLTLQTEVAGRPLDRGLWLELGEGERERVARQLGGMFAVMHTMSPDLLPVVNVEPWWSDGEATSVLNYHPRTVPGRLQVMKERVGELLASEVSAAELEVVEETFEQMDRMLGRGAQQRCLTHGALVGEHVLWQPDGGVGVIDFSDMTVGDPAVDFMHLSMIDAGLPQRVLDHAKVAHEVRRAEARKRGTTDLMNMGDLYDQPNILQRAEVYKRWDDIALLMEFFRTGRGERVRLV